MQTVNEEAEELLGVLLTISGEDRLTLAQSGLEISRREAAARVGAVDVIDESFVGFRDRRLVAKWVVWIQLIDMSPTLEDVSSAVVMTSNWHNSLRK